MRVRVMRSFTTRQSNRRWADREQMMNITVRRVGIEQMSEVHRIMQLAFEEYRGRLVPPSGALTETSEEDRTVINRGGAFLDFVGGVTVGGGRYRLLPEHA